LQWEKKTTPVGSGMNPADLHDVDNRYSWAGCCGEETGGCCGCTTYCQPNAAAEAACKAQTPSGQWASGGCNQCAVGTCNVDPWDEGVITTVWDWLSQVNAASFAGHSNWRLPIDSGQPSSCGVGVCEASSLFDDSVPGCHQCLVPCIDPIFGPTDSDAPYWSSNTRPTQTNQAWATLFLCGGDNDSGFDPKDWYLPHVRAVRSGP
jgi:hypothetical protein